VYRVSVIGTGFVGLCTAVCFADRGYNVLASTKKKEKASLVNEGTAPFHEPNLEEMLQKAVESGRLKAVLGREEAVLHSDVSFITVGTPSNPDGSIDLRLIRQTAEEMGKALKESERKHLVVVKSTVIPGTTEKVVKPIIEQNSGKRCGEDFFLCSNPEFLREGAAIHGTLHPDFIVIGERNKKSGDLLEELYLDFHKGGAPPILRTNPPTAELIKYVNNSFLATKISFINTIANICEKIAGVDVRSVAEAIGKDHRISPYFLRAGLGWGGSCFSKDIKALIAFSKSLGYEPNMLETAWKANESQVEHTVEIVKNKLGPLKGKKIAILGLSFKPDTDDIREARSVKIIKILLEEGVAITAYDPQAIPNVRQILGKKIEYATSAVECFKNTDCCILATEWDEFKRLKPKHFTENMRHPILIDGRRIYDPKSFSQKLDYVGIGLG
jgi:UDPglucose 6-dehydrogenase